MQSRCSLQANGSLIRSVVRQDHGCEKARADAKDVDGCESTVGGKTSPYNGGQQQAPVVCKRNRPKEGTSVWCSRSQDCLRLAQPDCCYVVQQHIKDPLLYSMRGDVNATSNSICSSSGILTADGSCILTRRGGSRFSPCLGTPKIYRRRTR